MFLQTLLMGFALETISLDELGKPGWHETYYQGVVFQAWGMIEIDVTGRGLHRLRWDTRHPESWANYLKARAELARTPLPYGFTWSGARSTYSGSPRWLQSCRA